MKSEVNCSEKGHRPKSLKKKYSYFLEKKKEFSDIHVVEDTAR